MKPASFPMTVPEYLKKVNDTEIDGVRMFLGQCLRRYLELEENKDILNLNDLILEVSNPAEEGDQKILCSFPSADKNVLSFVAQVYSAEVVYKIVYRPEHSDYYLAQIYAVEYLELDLARDEMREDDFDLFIAAQNVATEKAAKSPRTNRLNSIKRAHNCVTIDRYCVLASVLFDVSVTKIHEAYKAWSFARSLKNYDTKLLEFRSKAKKIAFGYSCGREVLYMAKEIGETVERTEELLFKLNRFLGTETAAIVMGASWRDHEA